MNIITLKNTKYKYIIRKFMNLKTYCMKGISWRGILSKREQRRRTLEERATPVDKSLFQFTEKLNWNFEAELGADQILVYLVIWRE